VKRTKLLQHLQRHGCVLKREGGSHSIWRNPHTNKIQAIPRHSEIGESLARKFAGNYRCQSHDLEG
jgi:mRNA interferase HicA